MWPLFDGMYSVVVVLDDVGGGPMTIVSLEGARWFIMLKEQF